MDEQKLNTSTRKLSNKVFQELSGLREIGIVSTSSKDLVLTYEGVAYRLNLEPLEEVLREPQLEEKYTEDLFRLAKKYL